MEKKKEMKEKVPSAPQMMKQVKNKIEIAASEEHS